MLGPAGGGSDMDAEELAEDDGGEPGGEVEEGGAADRPRADAEAVEPSHQLLATQRAETNEPGPALRAPSLRQNIPPHPLPPAAPRQHGPDRFARPGPCCLPGLPQPSGQAHASNAQAGALSFTLVFLALW